MTNNFAIIRNLLKFEDPNEFYFVQVLQRTKDSDLKGHNRLIRSYHVFNLDHLDEVQPEIVTLCETFTARAYVHLNRRNSRKIALEMLVDLAGRVQKEEFSHLHRLHDSVCGRHHSDKDKSWVVDVDHDKNVYLPGLIETLSLIEPVGPKAIAVIPTKNGSHVITRPFNCKIFSERYPGIDVHENNPTVLYA